MSGERCSRGGWMTGVAALALFLLPAAGCVSEPPPPAGTVIDLVDVVPWQAPDPGGLVDAERTVWSFARGVPEGWTAGPPGVVVHREEDGIRLEHPEELPWLELRFGGPGGFDPMRWGRVHVGMRPLEAREAGLYFSFVDPPLYARNIRSRIKYARARGRIVHGFDLPGAGSFDGNLRVLRLYPSLDEGSAVVRRAVIVPRDRRQIAEHVLGRERVALGQVYRRCWRLVGPGLREATLRLPAGASELSWAAGTLAGGEPASVTVALQHGRGEPRVLGSGTAPATGAGWQEHRADLSPWAGEEVTLRFSVDGGAPGSVTLIGSPLVKPAAEGPGHPPSVLLILVDTLRADRLSVYGAAERISPHLDRLAREGLVFTETMAPSSWTMPSVAALLTGRQPGELGVGTGKQGGGLTPEIRTMAEGFAGAGFDTASFSANYILNPFKGYARGFDAFYLAPVKHYGMTAGELNRRALDWFDQRTHRPFFCYVQYMDPHSPYSPPGSHRHVASNAASFDPARPDGYRDGHIHRLVLGWERLESEADAALVARAYDEEVSYVDREIGRLLAGLGQRGLLENTVVAVVADHGEEFFERGFWSHGYTLYDEQLRVPFIFRLPGGTGEAAPGAQVATPVSLVDLMPTLHRLAGIEGEPPPGGGGDVFSLPAGRELISETWAGEVPPRFAIRSGPWKYVLFRRDVKENAPKNYPGRWVWFHGPAEEELYHLENDPAERHNVADEHPEVVRRLREELQRRFGEEAMVAAGGDDAEEIDEETEERLRALGYIQ